MKQILSVSLSLIASFAIVSIILLFLRENPVYIFNLFLIGAFGTAENFGNTLFYMTPLVFTGLAVAVAFRAGLFNIGAEGQLYLGAFGAFWVAVHTGFLPGPIAVSLAVVGAFALGAFWGFIPGYLKSRFGAHEVIITIMLNFIAVACINYLVTGPYHAPGDQIPQTFPVPESARLSFLGSWLASIGVHGFEEAPLNSGFILAIVSAVLVYILLWKTKWGYEIRAVGLNREAARAAGISVDKISIAAIAIGGGFAGLVGINEVLGYRYQLVDGFSPGLGYAGIAVALLGLNHPVGVLLAAFFFGVLSQGGMIVDIYSDTISRDMIYIIQGIIILCVISQEVFGIHRRRLQ